MRRLLVKLSSQKRKRLRWWEAAAAAWDPVVDAVRAAR